MPSEREAQPGAGSLPSSKHGLHYSTPAATWDEALPLGNGIMGALVWGDGAPLRLSLDRTDLWDLRPIPEFESEEYSYAQMRRWHEEGRPEEIVRLYDEPYNRAAPTKIPAGRIEIEWDVPPSFAAASLDLREAIAELKFAAGQGVRIVQHATEPLGLLIYDSRSSELPRVRLVAPAFRGTAREGVADGGDFGDLAALGYLPPLESSGENWRAYTQQGLGDFHFAVYVAWRRSSNGWDLAWSVASSNEGDDPLMLARGRVNAALQSGFDELLDSHRVWWEQYWGRSSISVPNALLERQWYLDQYKFGAASRRGAPPINLQGPWTADDGRLPPWKGDYHNDLNTQMSYWACYSANHLEEGLSFIDWLWQIRPVCKAWTESYFGMPGLNVPGVCDLAGGALGGWPHYSFSATTAAWLAQHFYWHWRYSGDTAFLRERAYPYVRDAALFIEAMTEERDENGLRRLPLSSSPEMNDNRPEAWFSANTNHDLALMRWLMLAAAGMAEALAKADGTSSAEARRWLRVKTEFPQLATGPDGRLLIAPGYPLPDSHRHHAHLMAIYPLKILGLGGSGREGSDGRTIAASLRELEEFGGDNWTGYSFAWFAALHTRRGDGEGAEKALATFARAFTLRNSFHCNGDQSGEGHSTLTYRPFTMEGNFGAAAALQEMLLQSDGGLLRIFPAIPDSWTDVSFTTLRAEGGYLVSAEMRDGRMVRLSIKAEHDGACLLLSPFSGQVVKIELGAGEEAIFEGQK